MSFPDERIVDCPEATIDRYSVPLTLDLRRPQTWPAGVLALLGRHHDLFLDWEQEGPVTYDVASFELAFVELCTELGAYSTQGIHCTRLTCDEIEDIRTNGVHLPDAMTLHRRIDTPVDAERLTPDVAALLKASNQAGDTNRAGKLWFCFGPPAFAGEAGIGRFFRHWGGEALYNSHEDNPVTSAALSSLGTPCLVIADVPITALGSRFSLARSVVRRFLMNGGHPIDGPVECEGYVVRGLPAANIREVVHFPEPEFLTLTGCMAWKTRLS